MVKSFLKIAWRNFWRHKASSFVNLIGLVAGLSACFLIYLYVSYERSYDSYHTRANRIYRLVVGDDKTPGSRFVNASAAMGPALRREFPDIQDMVRISFKSFLIERDIVRFHENNVMYADSSLFSVFSFPFIKGDPKKALTKPYSVVLSETAARRYFGDTNPIGQSLSLDESDPAYGKYDAIVTAVIYDMPSNSHFRSDVIVSMNTLSEKLEKGLDNYWESPVGHTYLLLPDKYNPEKLQVELNAFAKRNTDRILLGDKNHFALTAEPLKEIYLHGKYAGSERGNIYNLYIFSSIAIFILLIAAINFINLTTAGSSARAKEVGIRKVAGSSRIQLIWQFLGESLLLCLVAFAGSCIFCAWFLPVFNGLCGKIISYGVFEHVSALLFLLGIALLMGAIAGIYPAWVLSDFKPATVLKGRYVTGSRGIALRQILVVSQFAIAIIMIIGTIVVYLQLNFMRNQPLGFNKEEKLVIDFHGDPLIKNRIETIKNELSKLPGIYSASASSGIPNSGFEPADYEIENKSGIMQHEAIALYMVDEDFLEQYKIKLLAGRKFSKSFPADFKNTLIVNEAALDKFGYHAPGEIIGKRFSGEGEGTVIGVVKNFNFMSLHENIKPLVFRTFFLANRYITLNISSRNLTTTIKAIANRWNQLEPQRPLDYFFLDEAIDKQYKSEKSFGKLFLSFGILALFISCLGLFGLTLFSTYQRTKEIGIRKVLGAGVAGIVTLLSKDFLKLVVIAFIVASPVAWITMNKWLQGFAYRINISVWIFLVSGLTASLIAILTTSFLTTRAALAKPAISLRAE